LAASLAPSLHRTGDPLRLLDVGALVLRGKKAADPGAGRLRNQVRHDIGRFPVLSAEAVHALTTLYREHSGWTAQLLHDNLRVTLAAAGTKCPSYRACADI